MIKRIVDDILLLCHHQTSLMTRVIIGVVFTAGGTFVFDYLRTPNMKVIIG